MGLSILGSYQATFCTEAPSRVGNICFAPASQFRRCVLLRQLVSTRFHILLGEDESVYLFPVSKRDRQCPSGLKRSSWRVRAVSGVFRDASALSGMRLIL